MKNAWWVIAAPLVVAAIIGVSVFDQVHYAQRKSYTINCTHGGEPSGATESLVCVGDNHQDYDEGKPYPPSWNGFLAWPEGITAVLLALTLLAIAWQGYATQQAAKATEIQAEVSRKALILQYRPKITVRFASLVDNNLREFGKPATARVRLVIVNTGGSKARIVGGDVALWWSETHGSMSQKTKIHRGAEIAMERAEIEAGQRLPWEETLDMAARNDNQWVTYHEGVTTQDHRRIILVGTINYLDDLDIPRSTGLHRNYDPRTMSFLSAENEGEYDD